MSIVQYLKDTRGELRHVAWPTRLQTIIYTAIVIAISIGAALYLGLFDFIFTSGLARVLEVLPSVDPITITQQPAPTAPPVEFSTTTEGGQHFGF